MDQGAGGPARELGDEGLARSPIGRLHAHLDKLVIVQDARGFRAYAVREAVLTDLQHRFESMGTAAQIAQLFFA